MANKPGRPRLDDDPRPSIPVMVRLPARQYDRLYEAAERDRMNIPEYVRREIQRKLDKGD